MRWRIRTVAAIVSAAMVAGLAAIAPAAPSSPPPTHGQLTVGVEVLHFTAAGRRASASGIVSAKLTDNRGHVRTVRTRVALVASTGGSCRVLHLFLDQLNLQLLGLNAHLDKVQLDVTGQPHGGVLGSLFCRLARAKVARARASAVRALNAAVHRSGGGQALHFSAQLSPVTARSAAAGTTCPVLDLVVGPLNLQLLGLVVDLNRVHLTITATRGAGALGDLFCKLADNNTTTTTTTTTT